MKKTKNNKRMSSKMLAGCKFLSKRSEIRGNYSIKSLSKSRKLLGKDEQLSLANNIMFKTMFQSEERMVYPAYLISLVDFLRN